ncbi:hypothetical protein F0225_13040 [Vibrio pectenicida]|uniref:Uncharacterized protein n=1 Tax=Vibrio pectenicida TaxID=62763 RepID=A0A7Y4A0K3_9VIBR|nr:hypothetical protein [Vibrio pectenicida]NOH72256.1 hypothetical protein [Vibrio pectenicida]
MPRFIRTLQTIIAVVIGFFVGYDMIFYGVSVFDQKYVRLTLVLFVLLELALFVIYKLIEDD